MKTKEKKFIDIQKLLFGIMLISVVLFFGIGEDRLLDMLSCLDARLATYQKNEVIFAEGSEPKYISLVLSGTVQLERIDYYGNRSIVTRIEPSELFGESFACAKAEYIPISATATEKTEVLLIDCQKIISPCTKVCSFHSQLIFNLLKIVATKNIILTQKAEITSKRTTREKLMAYLMSEAKKQGQSSFAIPYDRQTLADYLGVDRSGLSAEISKLRTDGIIKCRKNHFELL